MQDRTLTLQPEGGVRIDGDVKRIVIRAANGPVRITTEKAEIIEMRAGDNVRFEKVSKFYTIENLSSQANRVTLITASTSEGDIDSTSDSVVVANAADISGGARTYSVRNYTATAAGVRVLTDTVQRRTALISTGGSVQVRKTQNAADYFTVDGVIEHPANGEVWVSGDNVRVEVLEYLI
ncbi:hypothetical protein [Bacterioplanoides sp.]|uniref:hypothetical protein n=1 Tax=Bacterioplanoides sp. TaxID=2066072 RepID=UPI003AFF73A2